MRKLWPQPANETNTTPELSDRDLEALYDYPADLDRPWVQVNFVSSADGAVSVGGKSGGLSNPDDKTVFALGRDLADVVLVGSTTALMEGYRGVRTTEVRGERRARLGLSEVPPIAVVTARCSVLPDSPLLTDTLVPPIILTSGAAPAERREALAAAGAEVLVLGDDRVDLGLALDALGRRGLRRVCCEGGPTLLGALVDADLVDQLCLTVAPMLAGGDAGRIARGPLPPAPRTLALESVLHGSGGALMLRYRRAS